MGLNKERRTRNRKRQVVKHPCVQDPDRELLQFNVRLAKARQAQADTNRIERKAFGEHARVHCSSPLWSDQDRPVLPPVDPSDRWAQRCNGYLDLECWGPPPWRADQWQTLLVIMEMAGE